MGDKEKEVDTYLDRIFKLLEANKTNESKNKGNGSGTAQINVSEAEKLIQALSALEATRNVKRKACKECIANIVKSVSYIVIALIFACCICRCLSLFALQPFTSFKVFF